MPEVDPIHCSWKTFGYKKIKKKAGGRYKITLIHQHNLATRLTDFGFAQVQSL